MPLRAEQTTATRFPRRLDLGDIDFSRFTILPVPVFARTGQHFLQCDRQIYLRMYLRIFVLSMALNCHYALYRRCRGSH